MGKYKKRNDTDKKLKRRNSPLKITSPLEKIPNNLYSNKYFEKNVSENFCSKEITKVLIEK